MDGDLLRAWQIVHELGEQLALNHKFAHTLQAQAAAVKDQAAHRAPGSALRRFNTDLTKETFESALERAGAQAVLDNQALRHENRQLAALLKEYESTLETIMAKFRNHALAAQQHELTLTRHYEALLLARETQGLSADLGASAGAARALQRLSHHLRGLLRTLAGEDPTPPASPDADGPERAVPLAELAALLDALDGEDWAAAREAEIARLAAENAALRRALDIDEDALAARGLHVDPARVQVAPRRAPTGGGGGGGGGGGWGPEEGAPLQRAMELQPRAGPPAAAAGAPGGRRLGTFGGLRGGWGAGG